MKMIKMMQKAQNCNKQQSVSAGPDFEPKYALSPGQLKINSKT